MRSCEYSQYDRLASQLSLPFASSHSPSPTNGYYSNNSNSNSPNPFSNSHAISSGSGSSPPTPPTRLARLSLGAGSGSDLSSLPGQWAWNRNVGGVGFTGGPVSVRHPHVNAGHPSPQARLSTASSSTTLDALGSKSPNGLGGMASANASTKLLGTTHSGVLFPLGLPPSVTDVNGSYHDLLDVAPDPYFDDDDDDDAFYRADLKGAGAGTAPDGSGNPNGKGGMNGAPLPPRSAFRVLRSSRLWSNGGALFLLLLALLGLFLVLRRRVVRRGACPLRDALLRLLELAVVARDLAHVLVLLTAALRARDRRRRALLGGVLVLLVFVFVCLLVLVGIRAALAARTRQPQVPDAERTSEQERRMAHLAA